MVGWCWDADVELAAVVGWKYDEVGRGEEAGARAADDGRAAVLAGD